MVAFSYDGTLNSFHFSGAPSMTCHQFSILAWMLRMPCGEGVEHPNRCQLHHCISIWPFTFEPLRACSAALLICSDLVAQQFLFGERWRRHLIHSVGTCLNPLVHDSIFATWSLPSRLVSSRAASSLGIFLASLGAKGSRRSPLQFSWCAIQIEVHAGLVIC